MRDICYSFILLDVKFCVMVACYDTIEEIRKYMARFFYMKKNEVYNMILLDTINHKDGKYSAVIFY